MHPNHGHTTPASLSCVCYMTLYNHTILCLLFTSGAEGIVPVQVVPGGLEPVNGSDTNMGCTNPLVGSGGWPILCPSDCLTSFLLDGNSPDIDTSTSDWASQLVTVRKRFTDDIPFQHALLTFGFDTAVSLTGIELDLFICPEWNIGAPYITVFANEEHNLSFSYPTSLRFENKEPTQLSCNSLSTISIPFSGALAGSSYSTWYILVSQLGRFNWVHVGEIRFLGTLSIPGNLSFEIYTPMYHNNIQVQPAQYPVPQCV